MRESLNIMAQALNYLKFFSDSDISNFSILNSKFFPPSRNLFKYLMENLILHFKLFTEGFTVNKEEVYSIVEAPKGEFGIFLVSSDSNLPYRCRIKAPGFLHLQGLNHLSKGIYLADLVTIIGTLDLVFGEIDR
jgi:NADH:ubiquinone oxidoreductase subunit D